MNTLKTKTALLIAALTVSGAASASVNLHGDAGENYTNLSATFGGSEPGFTFNGNWAHSDNDGDIAGLGIGYNFPLGSAILTFGGRGVYLNPNDGDEGYAMAVGGGAQLPLGDFITLMGEYYYSPDSLSSGVEDYVEANASVRFNLTKSMSIDAGYRYIEMAGKDGKKDNTLADGPYAGFNFKF